MYRSNRVPLAPYSVRPVINITIIVVKAIPILVHLSLSPTDDDYGPAKAALILSLCLSLLPISFVRDCLSVCLSVWPHSTNGMFVVWPPTHNIPVWSPFISPGPTMDGCDGVSDCLSVGLFVCLSISLAGSSDIILTYCKTHSWEQPDSR